jgi:hypothetical protein
VPVKNFNSAEVQAFLDDKFNKLSSEAIPSDRRSQAVPSDTPTLFVSRDSGWSTGKTSWGRGQGGKGAQHVLHELRKNA